MIEQADPNGGDMWVDNRPWCDKHGLMAQGANGWYCEDCEREARSVKNGALWNRDQLDAARAEAEASGNALALDAIRQVDATLRGVDAWKRAIDVERSLRCTYAAAVREVRAGLARPRAKATRKDLMQMIEMTLETLAGLDGGES